MFGQNDFRKDEKKVKNKKKKKKIIFGKEEKGNEFWQDLDVFSPVHQKPILLNPRENEEEESGSVK